MFQLLFLIITLYSFLSKAQEVEYNGRLINRPASNTKEVTYRQ